VALSGARIPFGFRNVDDRAPTTDQVVLQNQASTPWMPIPADDAIGLSGSSDSGVAEFCGYLVPAAVAQYTVAPIRAQKQTI
jgi:hypothetical protein